MKKGTITDILTKQHGSLKWVGGWGLAAGENSIEGLLIPLKHTPGIDIAPDRVYHIEFTYDDIPNYVINEFVKFYKITADEIFDSKARKMRVNHHIVFQKVSNIEVYSYLGKNKKYIVK